MTTERPLDYFEYEHETTLEESNVVGNIYFANYIRWQGKCRELFLKREAPSVLGELFPNGDLALITCECSCKFYGELMPLQRVRIQMSLKRSIWNRIGMEFHYYTETGAMIAEGFQEVVCKRRLLDGSLGDLEKLPDALAKALTKYRSPQ